MYAYIEYTIELGKPQESRPNRQTFASVANADRQKGEDLKKKEPRPTLRSAVPYLEIIS